jgi:exopolyphosphatase/guanosine-5'-triphosphate,3'-diphosphate pyrophosphatase
VTGDPSTGERGIEPDAALAAIDIGTNSVHLVVARVVANDRFEVVAREREMVRLGSGPGDMKLLSTDAMDRGIDALTRMRRVAEAEGASIRAVATSAVREAENHDTFVRRARDEAGVDVEVISGTEEARLIHLGVLQAVPVFDKRLMLVDIGGGSTELLIGERAEVLASRSLKLGAIRLTARFFGGERLHPAAVGACRKFVRSALAPFIPEVERLGFDVLIGSSGTIIAVAEMVAAARQESQPLTFNNFELTRDELDDIVGRLLLVDTVEKRKSFPGLDPRRADIILGGCIILEQVMHSVDAKRLVISENALREGVLLDTVQRSRGGTLHHLRDLSRASVLHLMEQCDERPDHSREIARLALALFDATASVHGLDETAREYLEAAALLANVGLFISHSKHHLHTYYVIRNSEQLTGFTDREIEIIAQVARYHRKSPPKPEHEAFAKLWPDDQELVRTLAGLLRVSIGLDRSYERRVATVRSHDDGERLTITLVPASGADIALEHYAADARKALLEEVLHRRITVEQGA